MVKDLYYEITKNGYHIYDRNDPLFHIHQYEPYIPDHSKSYEENAQAQMHELMVSAYASAVNSGEMTLDEVPEDYRAEVEAQINPTEPDPEQAVVDSIMQEVSSYGY
ncbi:MAG: CD1375 family protein [Anaerovoracaceae bacterium]